MPIMFAVFRRLPGDQFELFGTKTDRTEAASLAYALNALYALNTPYAYAREQQFTMYEMHACAAIKAESVLPEYRRA